MILMDRKCISQDLISAYVAINTIAEESSRRSSMSSLQASIHGKDRACITCLQQT